jgi:Predicted HD superfamily hydrolase
VNENIVEYVRNYLDNTKKTITSKKKIFPFRDRFLHTMRVLKWAERINEVEKGDWQVIQLAVMFHDVGKGISDDIPHAKISAEICDKYLKNNCIDITNQREIVNIVAIHSSKEMPIESLSLEARILMDADLLDEIGVLCILRDSMENSINENSSYYKVYEDLIMSLQEKREEAALLKTTEGRRLYEERLSYLESFIENLKYELGI